MTSRESRGAQSTSPAPSTPAPNLYEANRSLFDELDRETRASREADRRGDVAAWAAHAGRAAGIYQQIAVRLGWDTSAPRYDEETG